MDLELEAAGGGGTRAVSLSVDSPTTDLGRGDLGGGDGGPSRDRTVSRRHVSLHLLGVGGGVAFEVVGRNPVVVRSPDGGGGSGSGTSRVFRRGEKGELRAGDALSLSLSLKAPAFWAVRAREGNGDGDADVEPAVLDAVTRRERRTRERKETERERERRVAEAAMEVTEEEGGEALDSDVEGLDIDLADIDPVREFGFLSMGHEFDSYPKGRIRAPKDWNWFLEETKRSSDDEVSSSRRGRSKGQSWNKKKDGEGEEDWIGEGEDEKESLARVPSVKRPKYATRSKGPEKPSKENSKVGSGKSVDEDEDEDEEDEQDETLGGFLVNDEDDEPMEELSDEEEEFDDEEDDD